MPRVLEGRKNRHRVVDGEVVPFLESQMSTSRL